MIAIERMVVMRKILSGLFAILFLLNSFSMLSVNVFASGNESFETAKAISVNQTYINNLSSSSDKDYYKFAIDENGVVNISFFHEYVEYSGNFWNVYLYNANKEQIDCWSYYGNETEAQKTNNIGLPAGTYYIFVKRGSASGWFDVNYNVTVNFSQSSVWETELNEDYYTTSDNIKLNTKYYGSLRSSSDVDWFKFTLITDGKVNISFFHEYVSYSGNFWSLYLYNENKEQIDYWSYYGNETEPQKTNNIGLPKGTYYVCIKDGVASGFYDLDYNFSINFSASSVWETEFNEDYYTTSDSIKLDGKYYGSLRSSSDEDWFKFSLSSTRKVFITFAHKYMSSDVNYWKLYLYDKNKKQIDCWSYYGSETEKQKSDNIKLSKGTYYICIKQGSASSLSDVDYNFMVSTFLSTPKLTKISNTSKGVKVTWEKVSLAEKYRVYRKKKGAKKWSELGDVTSTSFVDTTAKSGTKYYYTVKAIKGETQSAYNKTGISKYYLADPTLKTPSSTKNGISLKWTKTAGAQGYIIYRKTGSGSYTKLKTEKGVSNLSYVDKSAKKDKKYTYKVKAYYSKTYSAYSNAKTIKDKY